MPCVQNTSREFLLEEIVMLNFRAYIIPILIVIGIIGNSFVINTFNSMQKLQPSRFNIYVIWITAFQIIDLIMNTLLDDFLGRGLTWASDCTIFIKLDTLSSFTCKIMNYVPKTAGLISGALLVIFSIDRLLTVYKPIKFRGDMCLLLPRLSIIFVICICVLLFLPQLIYSDLTYNDSTSSIANHTCQYVNSSHFGVQYSLYLSIVGGHILPTSCIAIINCLIVLRLRTLAKTRQSLHCSGSQNFHIKTTVYSNGNQRKGSATTVTINKIVDNTPRNSVNTIIAVANTNAPSNCVNSSTPRQSMSSTRNQQGYCQNAQNEVRRIIGHLLVTYVFLFFSIPLVVVIILRQKSDFENYATIYPLYAKRLVHLSKLFSSFDAIIYSCHFPIFLIYLPNFRYMFYLSIYSLPLLKNTKFSVKRIEQIEMNLSNRLRSRVRQSINLDAKAMENMLLKRAHNSSIDNTALNKEGRKLSLFCQL
uniref:G-protein coupled receptors family 1 profile domain-containing protein n=1 Tax=Trichobilharzia regenti TaxID=157069 RepID=A0AA85KLG6_TRIRE|nr:unnamed protein product [Trichobilharzia regenti]